MEKIAVFRISSNGEIEVSQCPENLRECGIINKIGPHPVIVLYLAYVGKARVFDENGAEMSVDDIVKKLGDKSLWITFSTFLDLRKRGKVPEPGASLNELVLERDGVCIYVYEENAMITPEELLSIVESSMRRECKVIIAVVDMYGDVTYYEVSKMSFPRIERR